MKYHRLLITAMALLALLLLACTSSCKKELQPDTTVPKETPKPNKNATYIYRKAGIESFQIQKMESMPVQVSVLVKGWLSDSCTSLHQITQEREGNDFLITITTKRPADVNCLQMIMPFEEAIPLEVLGLRAGTYTVTVNQMSNTFTLEMDNILQK
jgi:hypothetical protein